MGNGVGLSIARSGRQSSDRRESRSAAEWATEGSPVAQRSGRPKGVSLANSEQACYHGDMAEDNELGVRFELPLSPSINQQYATVQGRRVLSRASRR